ncbi:hypothetical protein CAPTEDRAFT_195197 [Capitella teleta]|uniref:Endonuclease/exonuclease/phosphatase domain-containing protein n=1 Tax=Capitella teleta TaxID=283909 RepID=R7U2B8_CAPTE|nr:hypothetical protein CAPTEDRAFT_195197 [Capitella teleta]|eukprot:ELU00038.1 hypothetical protein CAPTEDRAFT_195197 [Capitella teleta]
MAITETWLKEGDDAIITDLCPPNFNHYVKNRSSAKRSRGRGFAFLVSNEIKSEVLTSESHETFESLTIKLNGRKSLLLVLLYRPPSSQNDNFTVADFLNEFEKYLTNLFIQNHGDLIVLGEFNLHWNKQDEVHVKSFKRTLDALNMKQHVEGLSHTSKNTLDLLISDRGASDRVNGIVLEDTTLSDHFLIEFDLETNRVFARNNTRTCRKLRRIDMAQFVNTLQKNIANVDLEGENEDNLKGIERQCRRTNLAMHKDMFKVQSKYAVTLIKDKKAEYYQQRIRDADHKDTFKIVKTLLKPPDNQQGESIDEIIRVEELWSFFDNKIKKIHATLGTSADRDQDNVICVSSFNHFEPVTQDIVSMFIKRQLTSPALSILPPTTF